LEFHPLYCKEDLVLFSTSYDPVYLFPLNRLEERGVMKEEGYREMDVVGLCCQGFCLLLHSL
jgi:hypothetical protein